MNTCSELMRETVGPAGSSVVGVFSGTYTEAELDDELLLEFVAELPPGAWARAELAATPVNRHRIIAERKLTVRNPRNAMRS